MREKQVIREERPYYAADLDGRGMGPGPKECRHLIKLEMAENRCSPRASRGVTGPADPF